MHIIEQTNWQFSTISHHGIVVLCFPSRTHAHVLNMALGYANTKVAQKFGVLQALLNKILHHHAKQVEIFAKLCYNMLTDIEVWLSLVERYVRDSITALGVDFSRRAENP